MKELKQEGEMCGKAQCGTPVCGPHGIDHGECADGLTCFPTISPSATAAGRCMRPHLNAAKKGNIMTTCPKGKT